MYFQNNGFRGKLDVTTTDFFPNEYVEMDCEKSEENER